MSPPAHLVLGEPGHGVRIFAEQLAAEVRAEVVRSFSDAAAHPSVHLHATDRLLADGGLRDLASQAACSRVSVTLHDVPQHSDGPAFALRRDRYRAIVASAHAWAVSSHHEESLVHEHLRPFGAGLVAPLPVIVPDVVPQTAPGTAPGMEELEDTWPTARTAAIFGFVYPGKGHRELIAAAAAIRDRVDVAVLALGAAAPGHHGLVDDLTDEARAVGVTFHVTGHLPDAAVPALLQRVDVGVCGHRNVSASGSTNQWLSAGRRPLMRAGRYAREMETLRPGCHQLYDDADLPGQLLSMLAAPERTQHARGVSTRPHLPDTARAYLDWWAER